MGYLFSDLQFPDKGRTPGLNFYKIYTGIESC